MNELKSTRGAQRLVYVGDGNNDFCPSTGLEEGHFVFPRHGYGLHHRLRGHLRSLSAAPDAPFMSLSKNEIGCVHPSPSTSSLSDSPSSSGEEDSKASDASSWLSTAGTSTHSAAKLDDGLALEASAIESFALPSGPSVTTWRHGDELLQALKDRLTASC